jgi:2-polyprenyl-3-methyl-5-hydroxy-6-metoxy-1,4-benzoquinol methylase
MINNVNIEEEIFCQRFEIESLADAAIRRKSERWIPGFSFPQVEKEHISRYQWVSQRELGGTILDVACGVGLGSLMIAEKQLGSKVYGWDISDSAIRYAAHRNRHSRVEFSIKNAEMFTTDLTFDSIISFETIEHLKSPKLFLEGAKKSMKKGGQIIISTPISSTGYNPNPDNPYHVQEWGLEGFAQLIQQYFEIESVYLQIHSQYYDSIVFRFKKWIYSKLKGGRVRGVINRYTSNGSERTPIKMVDGEKQIIKSLYGYSGIQIIVGRRS